MIPTSLCNLLIRCALIAVTAQVLIRPARTIAIPPNAGCSGQMTEKLTNRSESESGHGEAKRDSWLARNA